MGTQKERAASRDTPAPRPTALNFKRLKKLSGAAQNRPAADAERSAAHRATDAARTAAEQAPTPRPGEAAAVRDALAADPRLAALLGVEEIIPDTDASALVERLAGALDAAEQERTALLAEQSRDQRALRALGEGGLLPEPAEIEDVLRVLEAAGITAYSGWRYLAMLPAEARGEVVERRPHLVGGVLLNNAADAARARAEIAAARLLPCAVVAVGTTAAVATDAVAPGVEFVVPPNPAMVDEEAAATGAGRAVRCDPGALGRPRAADRRARTATASSSRACGPGGTAARRSTNWPSPPRRRAGRERDTAATAAAADADVAELDARAEALEADRPRLAAAAATTRERAASWPGWPPRPGGRPRCTTAPGRRRPTPRGPSPRRGRPRGGRAGPRGRRRGTAPRGPPHRRGRARPRRARRPPPGRAP